MIYVPNWGSGDVTVIDGATNATTTVKDPNASVGNIAAVNQLTDQIYVSNYGSNNITVIDGATNSTTTITDPNAMHPAEIAVNPQTDLIYVINGGTGPYAGSNNVTVIDGDNNSFTTVTPHAAGLNAVDLDLATNQIFVANWHSNNVTVIDGATNRTSNLRDYNAKHPSQLVVNQETGRVYVNNGGGYPYGGSNNVTVIGIPSTTSTSLTSSPNPSSSGQAVTFTATVTSSGGSIPDGEAVTFRDKGQVIGYGYTSGGVATFTTSTLAVGKQTVKASYSGDEAFGKSSATIKQTVEN
jgi:YVTN family beta-propeller protein